MDQGDVLLEPTCQESRPLPMNPPSGS
jgi:hypothetical protein